MNKELINAIEHLNKIKENLMSFNGTENISFQRTTYNVWNGKTSNSVWRILLDESKTKWCIRDCSGFRVVDKLPNDEVIIAPIGMKYLILSKNKQDRDLAKITLDQIADEKYGRNKKQS